MQTELTFKTITTEYKTIVTEELLFGFDCERVYSILDRDKALFLIAPDTDGSVREREWFGLAWKAWQKDASEDQIQTYRGGLNKIIRKQFDAGGGRRAIVALSPVPGLAPAPPAEVTTPVLTKSDLELKIKFPQLKSDAHFWIAKRKWESLGFDPWRDQFYVRMAVTDDGLEPFIILRLEEIRGRAMATECYVGKSEPIFDMDDDDVIPIRCRMTITRFRTPRIDPSAIAN